MAEREDMMTKILETRDGDYITVKGLRSGRAIDHEAYQEPAVEAWEAADAARRKSCEDLGITVRTGLHERRVRGPKQQRCQ